MRTEPSPFHMPTLRDAIIDSWTPALGLRLLRDSLLRRHTPVSVCITDREEIPRSRVMLTACDTREARTDPLSGWTEGTPARAACAIACSWMEEIEEYLNGGRISLEVDFPGGGMLVNRRPLARPLELDRIDEATRSLIQVMNRFPSIWNGRSEITAKLNIIWPVLDDIPESTFKLEVSEDVVGSVSTGVPEDMMDFVEAAAPFVSAVTSALSPLADELIGGVQLRYRLFHPMAAQSAQRMDDILSGILGDARYARLGLS